MSALITGTSEIRDISQWLCTVVSIDIELAEAQLNARNIHNCNSFMALVIRIQVRLADTS